MIWKLYVSLRRDLGLRAQRATGFLRRCAAAQWIWRAAHGSAAGREEEIGLCNFFLLVLISHADVIANES
jgi:hypothetical protein